MNDELKIKNNELGGKMNYRYRTDEEMKDSGIEWLGKMPKSWNIRQLKRVLIDRKENNSPVKTDNILSLTMEKGVIPYSQKGSGGNKAKEDLSLYKLVYPDDIVLNSMNVVVGSVGLSKYFGCASPAYYMLYKKNVSDSIEYYNNIFQSKLFQESLVGLGNGILVKKSEISGKLNTIRMRIPMEKLNVVKIPIPKSSEQKKIAKFLDEKTVQFDSIISKKEALIEKLEEAKKSLISEVVTGKVKVVKSCDGYELVERKKEEMKDSGVEWLGDIPKEWSIKKLKHISILNPSKSEVRKYLEEDIEVSFIPMESVRLGYINVEQSKKISEIIDGYTYFKNDDIVMAKVTPCFENRNIAISENLVNGIGFGSTELNVIRCIKKEDIEYLYYSLQEEKFINVATSEMTGAGGLKRVPSNFLINAQFAYPNTTNEKEKIIKYLNEKEIEIKYIIDKTKQQIEKLKEAKQSLISEAVTGKIEILD